MFHETFRRFKYEADNLFVHAYPHEGAVQFVVHHGDQQFAIDIARGLNTTEFMREWHSVIEWWNVTATAEEREVFWLKHRLNVMELKSLLDALRKRGFPLPTSGVVHA